MPLLKRVKRGPQPCLTQNQPSDTIFITGGIGDVLAVSCFMDVDKRIRKVFYATKPSQHIIQILERIFPGAEHSVIWHDWKERDCFYTLEEFGRVNNDQVVLCSDDWSIYTVFKQQLVYKTPKWLGLTSESVLRSKFNLPEKYAVLCPKSTDKRDSLRDFTQAELESAFNWCETNKIPLVCVYSGNDPCTLPRSVLDLQNRTSMLETIAVVENADWYIGIDSCQSQVSTKVLPADRLLIKSVNPHYYRSLKWYCCPHTKYPFVVKTVTPHTLNCLEIHCD